MRDMDDYQSDEIVISLNMSAINVYLLKKYIVTGNI